jgi:cell division protein FtsA
MDPVGLIDFRSQYTEFAAQFTPSKRFDAIIQMGSVHITNDISIGLRIPGAQAEKMKRRFDLGQDPQRHPTLESQVQDARFYQEIVHARVSEILDRLERKFPNDFPTRDLTGGLWITGGGSKLPGLTHFLQSKYSLPVQQMSDLSLPWNSSVHAPAETWSAVSLLCQDAI